MNPQFISFALILVSLSSIESVSAQINARNSYIERSFSNFGIGQPNGVKDFFELFSKEEIVNYKSHKELNIAIYAAWMTFNSDGDKDGDKESRRSQFVDFVKQRLQIEPPSWWSKALIESQLSLEDSSFLVESDGIVHRKNINIEFWDMSKFKGKVKDERFDFEWGSKASTFNEYHKEEIGFFSIVPISDRRRVFAVSNIAGLINLGLLDEKQELIWQTEFDGDFQRTINGARGMSDGLEGNGMMDIVEFEESIFVFGMSDVAIYLISCDATNGQLNLRFTTNF